VVKAEARAPAREVREKRGAPQYGGRGVAGEPQEIRRRIL